MTVPVYEHPGWSIDPNLPWSDQVPGPFAGLDPAQWLTEHERATLHPGVARGRAKTRQRTAQRDFCAFVGIDLGTFDAWHRFVTGG